MRGPAFSPRFVAVAICLAGLVPRIPNLSSPLLERHDFRQTQTAITVQAWLDRGVSVFAYETPVFGPPWRVPFEFPTYQLSAFVFARLGFPLDLACRIAALLWFYASAALLFSVVLERADRRLALFTLAAYVAMPFTVLWSRAALIDFASVALSLAYLRFALRCLERPRAAPLAACLAAGVLAAVTKITTVPIVAVPLAIGGVASLIRAETWRGRGVLAGTLAAIGLVPLGAGVAWTRYADAVKAANPQTRWLVSGALADWTFGTVAQRLSARNWIVIFGRIQETMLPGLFALLVAVALVGTFVRRDGSRAPVAAAVAAALVTIATFFNLFVVHDYYLISITPCVALLAAYGVDSAVSARFRGRDVALALAGGAAVLSAGAGWSYLRPAYAPWDRSALALLGQLVAESTPGDRWIAVEGDDWNPRIPYLAHRRAFMIRPPADIRRVADRPELRALVCRSCPPAVLSLWPRRRWVAHAAEFDVFQLWPAGIAAPTLVHGALEHAGCDDIHGWAWDPRNPRQRVTVEILDSGTPVATAVAGSYRNDLIAAGIHDGAHAFSLPTPASLRDRRAHSVSARLAGSGLALDGTQALSCPPAQ